MKLNTGFGQASVTIPRGALADMKRDARSRQHAQNGLNGGRAQARRQRQAEKASAKASSK